MQIMPLFRYIKAATHLFWPNLRPLVKTNKFVFLHGNFQIVVHLSSSSQVTVHAFACAVMEYFRRLPTVQITKAFPHRWTRFACGVTHNANRIQSKSSKCSIILLFKYVHIPNIYPLWFKVQTPGT